MNLIKRHIKKKDFCNIAVPSEATKILEFDQNEKSAKIPFFIYADLECLMQKIDGCKNNLQDPFKKIVSEHIPSSLPMSRISLFKSIENKHDVCNSGKDCMRKFCES